MPSESGLNLGIKSTYRAWCLSYWHEDGTRCSETFNCSRKHIQRLEWEDGFENLVVTEGRNLLLDNTFTAIPSSVNWYVGLKDSGTPAASDTMANHPTWSEMTPYFNTERPAWQRNGAASGGAMSNSGNKAVFWINSSVTVYGAFMTSSDTKGGTSGKLYGVGDFGQPRSAMSGDSINVRIELSITAS
jgi:hypothetical protein